MLNLVFDHLGLAVAAPEPGRIFLAALGYAMGEPVHDPLQGVQLQLCTHASMPDVEMIWAEAGAASPLAAMLKKRDGLVYHMCYRCDDVPAALREMESLGLKLLPVAEAKPAVLFGGMPVSFHYVHGVGLIELIHSGEAP